MWRFAHDEKRTLRLLNDEGREQGRVTVPSWWTHKAELMLPEGIYTIDTQGIFNPGLVVRYNGVEVAQLRFTLFRGIQVLGPQKELLLSIRRPSVWKAIHEVHDAQHRLLAVIEARASWKRILRTCILREVATPPPPARDLLLAAHAIQVLHRRQVVAAAAV